MDGVAEELADELWWLLLIQRLRIDVGVGDILAVSPPGTICGGCGFVSTRLRPCRYWADHRRWFCDSCSVLPVRAMN